MSLYYWTTTQKNWVWISVVGLICAIVTNILAWFVIPESPKFLINQGRFLEAKEALDKVAKINGKENTFNE